jgi:NAD(P)-dependent dehydrogenase (short-subunit alcohol dehydrogenase family)
VAAAIMFLIKNDFVTGTTVDVDGGWLLSYCPRQQRME